MNGTHVVHAISTREHQLTVITADGWVVTFSVTTGDIFGAVQLPTQEQIRKKLDELERMRADMDRENQQRTRYL